MAAFLERIRRSNVDDRLLRPRALFRAIVWLRSLRSSSEWARIHTIINQHGVVRVSPASSERTREMCGLTRLIDPSVGTGASGAASDEMPAKTASADLDLGKSVRRREPYPH